MTTFKVRQGDEVIVISGKDRGKTGRVVKVDVKKERVVVEGINIQKRHVRPQQMPNAEQPETLGGVIEVEGSVHISNVSLIDPETNKPTRVGIKRTGGDRVRVARRSGKDID